MLLFRTCSIFACISLCCTQKTVTVNTNVGSIMGYQEYISVDGEQKLISTFLGIPFAESTVGPNRFMKPVPKAPFQGTFDARGVPAACYQQSDQDTNILRNYGVTNFSEDCLTLNIYVPHELRSNDLLPVMIWIYGGGFTQGASSVYKAEALALFGNVIVVTINYRIGMFGFLRDSNGAFPGNQGLWDQHLAIKWVNDNIDRFFGYKDEITIFGESAGSASVMLQAIYPGNKGLLKRVIAESGVAVAPWAVIDATTFETYLNNISCASNSKTFITCLQSKSPSSLQSSITQFGPVIDGEFLLDSPKEIVTGNSAKTAEARDFFASLDVIVGANSVDGAPYFGIFQNLLGHSDLDFNISKNEFRDTIVPFIVKQSFVPKDNETKIALEKMMTFLYTDWKNPDDYIGIRAHTTDMSSDALFFAPAAQTVDAHATLNSGKTYLYEFAVQVRKHVAAVPSWIKGSNHADEIPFVFGLPLLSNASVFGLNSTDYTSEEKQVARATMAMWSNFAKSGNPNMPMDVTVFTNTTWPEYDMTSQSYFQISNQMSPASVIQGFYPRRMTFWSEVIPEIIKKNSCPQKHQDILHFDPSANLVG